MEKKQYTAPAIEMISLDNEISLALESAPPVGPSEAINSMVSPERFSCQPFNDSIG